MSKRVPRKRTNIKKSSLRATADEIKGLADGLIITTAEARKILGKDAEKLSEEELSDLIFQFTSLAQILLNNNPLIN